ncbi:hypothetical protein ACHAWF_014919 [Thalassiosira exigua]
MAFPMVLAGTCLMACVGYYILPYGWSFNLSMTFGAILFTTDPVAVCALLNEVGAPPRLRMHIAGECLLNDGVAMVFFFIFSQMFLYELQILGLGQDIGVGDGLAVFFQMSLGAVGVGLAFGLGLVSVLWFLNRRFNGEEAVCRLRVQPLSPIYHTTLLILIYVPCSGVLAVVTTGVISKSFGERLIADMAMMDKFWNLAEFLLNSRLFVLGGVVWGTVVSNHDPRRIEDFTGKDWGYLFVVYLLAMVVRFLLFISFYPILSRIRLGTNPKESFFAAFGGLRGAGEFCAELFMRCTPDMVSYLGENSTRCSQVEIYRLTTSPISFAFVLRQSASHSRFLWITSSVAIPSLAVVLVLNRIRKLFLKRTL